MVKRRLVTATSIMEAVGAKQTTLEVAPDTVITPLARDAAHQHGLTFLQTNAPETLSPPHANTVAIGSDHRGYTYKTLLKPFIQSLGWTLLDVGTDTDVRCDYPDYAFAIAQTITLGKADFGVMIDGTGHGSAMVCNKVPGIRAICTSSTYATRMARAHGNTQILTLGSRTLGIEVCKTILQDFLETTYVGGHHQQRLEKIADIEAKFMKQANGVATR